MIALDPFRYATDTIFLVGAILAVMLSLSYLGREGIVLPEYYLLILLGTVGMMFMGGGQDLIVIFLGLELMSVSVYVLSGINRRSVFAAEAALKYFLIGAFASGFFLYGIALIYGATGSTDLTQIYIQVVGLGLENNLLLIFGIGLLLIGFGFKVAAVPFHMWAPDVYDGAPTPVTAYMAAAVKAAGFAALIRVLLHALGPGDMIWTTVIWWLAVITMVGGNLIALAQSKLKRMLAYSSIQRMHATSGPSTTSSRRERSGRPSFSGFSSLLKISRCSAHRRYAAARARRARTAWMSITQNSNTAMSVDAKPARAI